MAVARLRSECWGIGARGEGEGLGLGRMGLGGSGEGFVRGSQLEQAGLGYVLGAMGSARVQGMEAG